MITSGDRLSTIFFSIGTTLEFPKKMYCHNIRFSTFAVLLSYRSDNNDQRSSDCFCRCWYNVGISKYTVLCQYWNFKKYGDLPVLLLKKKCFSKAFALIKWNEFRHRLIYFISGQLSGPPPRVSRKYCCNFFTIGDCFRFGYFIICKYDTIYICYNINNT